MINIASIFHLFHPAETNTELLSAIPPNLLKPHLIDSKVIVDTISPAPTCKSVCSTSVTPLQFNRCKLTL